MGDNTLFSGTLSPKQSAQDPKSSGKEPEKLIDERSSLVLRANLYAVGLGSLIILIRGLVGGATWREAITYGASSLVVAFASMLVGTIFGFIFGIPRSLAQQGPREPSSGSVAEGSSEGNTEHENNLRSDYRPNTNLEQISDWLTKILVGVGLTNLGHVPSALSSLATQAAPAFGTFQGRETFALGVMLFFALCGFLLGYLWTRIYLPLTFAQADMDVAKVYKRVMSKVTKRLDEQAERDARALALIQQQLELAVRASDLSQSELDTVVREASESAKAQIFYEAQKTRHDTWRQESTLPIMERTIPIFRALHAADTEKKYHRNLGQLGFALADKRGKEYKEAIACLTEAIRLRGPWEQYGWVHYELVRATCRIELSKKGVVIDPKLILEDLRAVAQSSIRGLLESDPNFKEFLLQQNIQMAELATWTG